MGNAHDFTTQARDLVSTTLFGATDLGEMTSHYSDALDALQPGQLRYQLRAWVSSLDEASDSNISYSVMGCEILVFYMVLDLDSEKGFTDRDMLDFQATLVDPDSWRDLASVYGLEVNPEVGSAPEMDGGVLSFEISLTARIA